MPMLDNERHEIFAQHVASGTPRPVALRLVGYNGADGTNGFSLRRAADALAHRAEVRARIDEIRAAAAAEAGVTVERIVSELEKIAFSNLQDVLVPAGDGTLMHFDFSLLTRSQAAAFQDYQVDKMHKPDPDDPDNNVAVDRVRLKMYSKVDALVRLGQHLGMFKEAAPAGSSGNPLQHEVKLVHRNMTAQEAAEAYAESIKGK